MGTSKALLFRYSPGLAALTAFIVLFSIRISGATDTYIALLGFWGIDAAPFPFLDLDGSLAAWECSRRGIDVILSNPCDILNRGYNYSPFWMTIDWIPLGQADRSATGLALTILFLVAQICLPPSLSGRETALRVFASTSTMVAFAIERANPDLIIFSLTLSAIFLIQKSKVLKIFGYFAIFLAGAIKYYPFILFTLIIREQRRLAILLMISILFGVTLFFYIYSADILKGLPTIARGSPFGDMFAAKNLVLASKLIVQDATNSSAIAIMAPFAAAFAVMAIALCLTIVLRVRSNIPAALQRLDEARRLSLMAGSLLLVGCFFAGQSVGYRGIFFLFTLPGLCIIARDPDAGFLRYAARAAILVIPVMMWYEAIRFWIHLASAGQRPFAMVLSPTSDPIDFLVWAAREVTWWLVMGVLLAILQGFVKSALDRKF